MPDRSARITAGPLKDKNDAAFCCKRFGWYQRGTQRLQATCGFDINRDIIDPLRKGLERGIALEILVGRCLNGIFYF